MTEITEEMVETVARALCRNKYLAGHAADAVEWLVDRDWRGYASDARAALTAAFASRPSHGGEWDNVALAACRVAWPNFDAFGIESKTKRLQEMREAMLSASPSPYGVEAKITDAMLLAGCKVLHPSIFSTGLEPRPSDGPATRAVIVEDINKVRSILTAALSLTKDQSNG